MTPELPDWLSLAVTLATIPGGMNGCVRSEWPLRQPEAEFCKLRNDIHIALDEIAFGDISVDLVR